MKKEAKKKTGKISALKSKIVAKIKKVKKPAVRKAVRGARGRAVSSIGAAKVQEIAIQETRAQEAKFYTGAVAAPVYQRSAMAELEHKDLPGGYGENLIVLQVRDPWWVHSYWDIHPDRLHRYQSEFGKDYERAHWLLRAYDVTFLNFDGTNAHRFFDTSIDRDARNWYLNLGAPGTSWCVDLGFLLPDGRFIVVARSNVVGMPLDGPSWVTDEEWMIPDEDFRRLYGMSVGLGPNVSSPVGKLWQERLKKDISSKGIASMGVSSPVGKAKEKIPFWLVVDCELIVYGATEPDAHVTVQGQPIKLRKDGTFTLRYALPDGKQEIPVVAKSAKIDETRTITPVVARRTTRNP